MKKLISLSVATLTVAMQGVAFAQTDQGTPITEREYIIVVEAVCNTERSVNEIKEEVASLAGRSMSSRKVNQLKKIAGQMASLPEIEKERMCME